MVSSELLLPCNSLLESMMLAGRRLVCPQPALIGRDSYQGDPTPPIYETLEGAAADSDTPVLLWLPGSGQLPDNELLRRLANALHGVGARMVITCAAHGDAAAALAQLHTAGAQRIYLGGHSKGGAEALGMSAALPRGCELAGVCTINPVPRTAAAARTRSLTIVGEQDGGAALLGASFAWRSGERVHLRSDDDAAVGCYERSTLVAKEGDHSLRWWADGAVRVRARAKSSP